MSFGHDVKSVSKGETTDATDNLDAQTDATGLIRKKTALQQALENSRAAKFKALASSTELGEDLDPEDEWEDDVCNHDFTVDLNEPHSNSGKFWKAEFSKYHGDAQAEMKKLVKYKDIAKKYAQRKDKEAAELSQKLLEEQEKVAAMEKRVADIRLHANGRVDLGSRSDDRLDQKLAEQSALAAKYRSQVRELESQLRKQDRSANRRINTSPRTEQTLLEVSRELRLAKTELRKMDRLRKENEELRAELESERKRATALDGVNRKSLDGASQPSWISKLEKEIRELKEAAQRKDEELDKLDALKEQAKVQLSQARRVLHEKNTKIADLEKEVRDLAAKDYSRSRSGDIDGIPVTRNRVSRDLKHDIESLSKPSAHPKSKTAGSLKRSVSAEDLTIDIAQRPSARQNLAGVQPEILEDPWPIHHAADDLTDSLLDIEEELKREKRNHMNATRKEKSLATTELDVAPFRTLDKIPRSPGARQVLGERVNHSSPKDDLYKPAGRRAQSSRAEEVPRSGEVFRSALDKLTSEKRAANAHAARATSYSSEAPIVDLLQDRFAQLGAPAFNDTILTANASRCTLPADRQAAARARLEQKRRERRTSGRPHDKENLRP